jgi:hypothetical protein
VAKGGGKFDALVRARGDEHGGRLEDDAVREIGVGVGKRSNAEYRQVSAKTPTAR